MSLRLAPDVINRSLGASPAHEQLADLVRQAVADLDLSPGELVPSENTIKTATGLSRPTIQRAFRELELEGLIVRQQGKRALVAMPPSQQIIRPGQEPDTSFVSEHGATPEDYTADVQITKERASAHDAEYLQVRKGTPVLRRVLLEKLGGKPVRIHRQAFRYSLVKGTAIAYEVNHESGVRAELIAAGIEPTHFIETREPRMPTRAERELLGLKVQAPVWNTLKRYVIAEDPSAPDLTGVTYTPVQVSRIITLCRREKLYIEGRLSPPRETPDD